MRGHLASRSMQVLLAALAASALALAGATAAASAPADPEPERGSAAASRPLGAVDWSKRARAAERYAKRRAGSVSFSLRAGGVRRSLDGDRTYAAASVVKVMLLVAYLRERRDSGLGHDERRLLEKMIRRSHNDSATQVRDSVGNEALEDLADRVGMDCFATSPSSWGSTRVCSADQALLMKQVAGLLPDRHRSFGMTQLRRIVERQRWGIPEAIGSGWTPYFKGGWFEDPDGWRIHQVALLRGPERQEFALAILTSAQPTRNYGRETVRGVAKRLVGAVTR